MKTKISFEVTDEEVKLIDEILSRADKMDLFIEDETSHWLDLVATNANGCKLNFKRMLNADDFNFVHDFCGIFKNIDRHTGKLKNCFLPRCHE